MALEVIFLGIYLPLFAYLGFSQKRLRDIVYARHPAAARIILVGTRSLPRSQRWAAQIAQFRTLRDPEIDKRILKLSRAEAVCGWAIIGPMGLALLGWLMFVAVGAGR